MDFHLSEDQQMIRESARKLAAEVIAPRAARLDATREFPAENFRALAEHGFAGILIPEQYGGAGLGNVELALVIEEVNRACASTGVTLSVHNSLTASPLLRFGSEAQKQRYLPQLATGEVLGAYALSEPGSGSDAAALQCRAVRQGDHYVLNGTKRFITSGDHAGLLVCMARTDTTHKQKGISAFLIESSFPGFKVGRKEDKMGLRASTTVDIVLEDCRVPAANRLGDEGQGFTIALVTLDGGRIGIGAQAVGIAQACLDASIKYAKERRQFQRPIADFQLIQWKLADMSTRIEASRLLIWRAAQLRDQGKPHTLEASQAKLMASQTANFCAREAVQIHGGAGYTTEFPVERYFRDARITELYEGTTEIQRLVIARNLLR